MPREIAYADRKRLVDIFAANAVAAPPMVGVQGYFRNLILQANLPKQFKQQRLSTWTGAAAYDGQELVNWAIARGVNPADRRYTTLGSILEPELPNYDWETACTLVALIFAYDLIQDGEERVRLAQRYQVPVAPPSGAAAIGPEIDWRGPDSDVELQGWFRPEPNLFDVGFLKRGMAAAASVCRVEVGPAGPRGTGVLIDRDLVLTNYHVLGASDAEVAAAAGKVVLRFGAFTNAAAGEDGGQAMALDGGQPILAQSPPEQHDFVLLRIGAGLADAVDIEPARIATADPAATSGVNILQHPEGKPMMLSLASNGVTALLPERGLVQYVSRTSGGSSGSPCFDDDWKMVALHHAARTKLWGVAGEGILISAIRPQIRAFLGDAGG